MLIPVRKSWRKTFRRQYKYSGPSPSRISSRYTKLLPGRPTRRALFLRLGNPCRSVSRVRTSRANDGNWLAVSLKFISRIRRFVVRSWPSKRCKRKDARRYVWVGRLGGGPSTWRYSEREYRSGGGLDENVRAKTPAVRNERGRNCWRA